MGKNQSASNITNIIRQDASGNIAFMSGSTMLMSLNNTGQMSGSAPAVSAVTASYADNFTVTGNLTAQTLVVQTITSSVDFVTGSTRFGSLLTNTHVFSGSVAMNPGGLFVSGSGQVGIGTVTPNYNLDISGTLRSTGAITAASGLFSQSAGDTLQVYQTAATNNTTAVIRQTGAGGNGGQNIGLLVDIQAAGDQDRIANFRYYDGSTYTSRMSILRGGNVGIGVEVPSTSKLQIAGDWNYNATNNVQLLIQGATNANQMLRLGYSTTDNFGYIAALENGVAYKPLVLQPNSGANVLIGGTTDNGYKLEVTGKARATTGFSSNSGSTGTVLNGTPYGIINVTTKGIYYIFAQLPAGNGDINYCSTIIVVADGAAARVAFSSQGAYLPLTLSGTLVSVQQNSGATQPTIVWTFMAQN
jgi:hypothetical protein